MDNDALDQNLVDNELLAVGFFFDIVARLETTEVLEDHIVVGFVFFLLQMNI